MLLRILQSIALGGEWAGAVLLAGEHASAEKRGFYTMFSQLGPGIGLALDFGTFLLTGLTMSNEDFVAWGWPIPFLASVVMVAIGLFVRLKIGETPNFERLKSTDQVAKAPVWDVIKAHPAQLMAGAGSLAMTFALFHTRATWLTGYGPKAVGVDSRTVLAFGVVGSLLFCVMVLVGGDGELSPSSPPWQHTCLAIRAFGTPSASSLCPAPSSPQHHNR